MVNKSNLLSLIKTELPRIYVERKKEYNLEVRGAVGNSLNQQEILIQIEFQLNETIRYIEKKNTNQHNKELVPVLMNYFGEIFRFGYSMSLVKKVLIICAAAASPQDYAQYRRDDIGIPLNILSQSPIDFFSQIMKKNKLSFKNKLLLSNANLIAEIDFYDEVNNEEDWYWLNAFRNCEINLDSAFAFFSENITIVEMKGMDEYNNELMPELFTDLYSNAFFYLVIEKYINRISHIPPELKKYYRLGYELLLFNNEIKK